MGKCILCILLVLLLFSACTIKQSELIQKDTIQTESINNHKDTHAHSPTNSMTESTEPTDPIPLSQPWYTKIHVSYYFDAWNVKVTERSNIFYYITGDGLCYFDPETEKEVLLINDSIIGICVFEECFYYYTQFEIFELIFGEEDSSVRIWEHPDRYSDRPSQGICGLMVHDGWFYIKDSGTSAIRYNPENGITEEFPGYFSHLVFLNQQCYYIDRIDKTFSIYEVDTEAKKFSLIRGDGISKRYSDSASDDFYYDELRSVGGQLYYLIRDTAQFYRFDDNGYDEQFNVNAWIQDSYSYENLCYSIIDGDKVNIYEVDGTGTSRLVLSLSKDEIYTGSYNSTCFLVTESAVFYVSAKDAPMEFAWKYPKE